MEKNAMIYISGIYGCLTLKIYFCYLSYEHSKNA